MDQRYPNHYTPRDWVNGPCQICSGRDKRCSQTYDGVLAVCYQPDASASQYKTGELGHYGVYRLRTSFSQSQPIINQRPVNVELTEETELLLNKVYRKLLNCWNLSREHQEFLQKRGFTTEQIERQFYRTSDNSNSIIGDLVTEFGSSLLRVPGFTQTLGHYHFRSKNALIIPTVNHCGSVINFRVRNIHAKNLRDRYFYVSSYDKRSNSGLKAFICAHTVIPKIRSDTRIWITEGEMKAHYASDKLSAIFISVPGVSAWSRVLPALEYLRAKSIVLAFDDDMWSNPQVAKCLVNLNNKLKEDGYEVSIAKW